MATEVTRTAEVLGNFPIGVVAVRDGLTEANFKVVANHAGELNMVTVDEKEVAEVRRILGSVAELNLEGIKPENLSAFQVYLGQARVTSTGGSMDKPGRLALHIYGRNMRTGEGLDNPQVVGEETLRSLFA